MGLVSAESASCRCEETQPLSEPVEPDRQRDDELELSVAAETRMKLTGELTEKAELQDSGVSVHVLMEGWLLVSCSCSSSSMQELKEESGAGRDSL